jgi:hypothetical protein
VNHASTMVRAIVTATGTFVNLWYVSHSGEDDLQIALQDLPKWWHSAALYVPVGC